MRVNSEQHSAGSTTEAHPLLDDGDGPDQTAGDGKFTQLIGSSFSPGISEFVVTTRGKTFVRERRQTLEIVSPVIVGLKATPGEPQAEVSLQPVDGAIDPNSIDPSAELTGPDGETQILELERGEDDIWKSTVDLSVMEGDFILNVALTGSTPEGRELDLRLEPLALQGQAENEAQQTEPPSEAPAAVPDMPLQSKPVTEEAVETEWVDDAILFVTGNLLLTLFGGSIFWFVRRRRGNHDIHLLEEGEAAI